MNANTISASLELLRCRGRLMLGVTDRLQASLPALQDALAKYIDMQKVRNLMRCDKDVNSHIFDQILNWENAQKKSILADANKDIATTFNEVKKMRSLEIDPRALLAKFWRLDADASQVSEIADAKPNFVPRLEASTFERATSLLVSALMTSSSSQEFKLEVATKVRKATMRRVLGVGAPPNELSLLGVCQTSIMSIGQRYTRESPARPST